MHIKPIILLLFISFTTVGQTQESYYYDSGQLKEEGHRKENQKNGPWLAYYESGDVSYTGSYNSGQKTGLWKYFFSNSRLESSGHYLNGQKTGEWIQYYPEGPIAVR